MRGVLGFLGGSGMPRLDVTAAHDLVMSHTPRQGGDVTVLESAFLSQGDLNLLFALGRHGAVVVTFKGNAEADLEI